MAVLRILGLGLIVAALATAIITATHPVEPWNALTQSLSQVWASVQSPSLNSVQTAAEQHLPSQVGETGVQTVLRLPVWVFIGLVGLVFLLIGAAGRKRAALAPSDPEALAAPPRVATCAKTLPALRISQRARLVQKRVFQRRGVQRHEQRLDADGRVFHAANL